MLRSISDVMEKRCKEIGTPCRYGGEEFTIVLPAANNEETRQVAESIREQVSDLSIRYGDSSLPKVTISIGVATYPEHGMVIQDVLSAADKALYSAKDRGKNQVVVAENETDDH